MADIHKEIHRLEKQLFNITLKQHTLSTEVQQLRDELKRLKYLREEQVEAISNPSSTKHIPVQVETPQIVETITQTEEKNSGTSDSVPEPKSVFIKEKSSIEKFIGENLISKIGIAITVIGVAIGVKYSIDNQLINPLVRIVLGYLLGLALLGVGIKLKEKYEGYSAVLVSGSIAIMYFITYAGYSFYNLIPQVLAFILMTIFTVFTIITAIHYNKQIIAQIGLVGAYAVPFLLSDGSGRVAILFTYMAIINIGILIISYKKYWKSLYYSSFVLTWLIYFCWFAFSYKVNTHFGLSLLFLCLFFIIFYTVFLLYKLIRKEQYKLFDIVPLLVNSFLFYGIGYAILKSHATGHELLGLFTLANAVIHFIVSIVIHKQKLVDKNLLYLIIILVFAFITITIPVQLDGRWITLLWAAEACLLFTIGRVKNIPVFEKISYPLMLLGFISLIMDWNSAYDFYADITPVFNIQFMTSMLFVAVFLGINYVHFNVRHPAKEGFTDIVNFCVPAMLLTTLYISIWLEISNYYNTLYQYSMIKISNADGYISNIFNWDLYEFKRIWLINYSFIFVSLLSILNMIKIKSKQLGMFFCIFFVLCMLVFLFFGLYSLSELRESYLKPGYLSSYYNVTISWIAVRYISLLFVGFSTYIAYKQIKQSYMPNLMIYVDMMLCGSLLWIVSSELIHWLDVAGSAQTYKLGLSILWGVYALMMIVLGIWKNKKYLRIGGIAVFGVTLLKLFFYDLSNLNTISKTIVLVILGILLLIVSFLYNKYKHLIGNDDE